MLELAAQGPRLLRDRREFLRAALTSGSAVALPSLLAARAAAGDAGRPVPDTAVIQTPRRSAQAMRRSRQVCS